MTGFQPQPDDLPTSVVDRFAKVATAPEQEQKFPIGPESAKRLGYDAADVDALPPSITASFCGVGNPFARGDPEPGPTVLNLGCGAGIDSLLAARRVGPTGRAIGVDMTPEMIRKARKNAEVIGLTNVEFLLGEIEHLPLPDGSVDLAISNGVLNLCPDKPAVLAEVFRVLKTGGRLQMAGILLEPPVTPEEVASKGSWSDGIAGAVWERSLLEMLANVGFFEAQFHDWTGYRTEREALREYDASEIPVMREREAVGESAG